MSLIQQFKSYLEKTYEKVLVIDERGDAHFVQIICIDPCFEGKNSLAKTRTIMKEFGDLQNLVHAISVKGFTPTEWEKERVNFEPTEYQHVGH